MLHFPLQIDGWVLVRFPNWLESQLGVQYPKNMGILLWPSPELFFGHTSWGKDKNWIGRCLSCQFALAALRFTHKVRSYSHSTATTGLPLRFCSQEALDLFNFSTVFVKFHRFAFASTTNLTLWLCSLDNVLDLFNFSSVFAKFHWFAFVSTTNFTMDWFVDVFDRFQCLYLRAVQLVNSAEFLTDLISSFWISTKS